MGIYRNTWGSIGIPVGSFEGGQHYLDAGHAYLDSRMNTWGSIRILGDLQEYLLVALRAINTSWRPDMRTWTAI